MEFIKVSVLTALPAILAFAAIWRFMTVSLVARPPAGTARGSEAEADSPEACAEATGLRKAA